MQGSSVRAKFRRTIGPFRATTIVFDDSGSVNGRLPSGRSSRAEIIAFVAEIQTIKALANSSNP
jgi:hypothetical protein